MLHVRGETDITIPCEEEKDACDLTRLTVTENGIYMPDEEDGYYQVDVNVPGVTEDDNGKVVVDGQLVDQTSRTITQNGNYDTTTNDDITVNVAGYPEPTGTINITQNGTSNVKDYASANVNVPNSYTASDEGKVVSGGALVAQGSQTITQNGTYDTTLINELVANISGGGGWENLAKYVQSTGTQWINTGYTCTSNTEVEIVANVDTTNAQYASLFGARNGDYQSARKVFLVFRDSSSLDYYVGRGAMKASVKTSLFFGSKSKYTLSKTIYMAQNANGLHFGEEISGGDVDDVNALYLLTFNQSGADFGADAHCSAKLYRFRIYEGSTLVMELLPHQENGVACLKDTVSGNLFYNQGTGDFVFGTDN